MPSTGIDPSSSEWTASALPIKLTKHYASCGDFSRIWPKRRLIEASGQRGGLGTSGSKTPE